MQGIRVPRSASLRAKNVWRSSHGGSTTAATGEAACEPDAGTPVQRSLRAASRRGAAREPEGTAALSRPVRLGANQLPCMRTRASPVPA
jgi:hypothetical protein